jgi:hypothetical protein
MNSVDWTKARWKEIPALQNLLLLSDLSSGDIPVGVPRPVVASPSASSSCESAAAAAGFDGLSDLGRQIAPAERLTLSEHRRIEDLLASCPALLHLSDASTTGDEHMKAIQAKIALRYSHDPWVQYEKLVQGRFSASAPTDENEKGPISYSPNRGFMDSDVVGYEALALRERAPPSMHECGGETEGGRLLSMQAPFESLETFEEYRDQLTTMLGRQLAVEQRMGATACKLSNVAN